MAEVVGRVDFLAEMDGRRLVRDAKKIGRDAGEGAAFQFGSNFDKQLSPQIRKITDGIGRRLNDSVRIDGRVVKSNSVAFHALQRDGESAFDRLATKAFAFGVQAETSVRKFWRALEEDRTSFDRFNLQWRDLSHNTRQWTLIIGAVAAGMQHLSVLSSALGGGLFAVGGALGSLVAGAGGVVAVFTTLAKDVDDLPPALRGVATQFRGLGRDLLGIRDTISAAAFSQMPNTFSRLSRSVNSLRPEFAQLGASVGRVFDDFSLGLAEGSDGLKELRKLVDNAASDFPALGKAAGTWAVALLRGLNKANPIVDQLIGYVDLLGQRFDAFTRSTAFDQWITNSMQTFRRFGELLDATGRALNDLVTPESIVRTQAFLGNLTDFMPNLSRLLDLLGRLDVFGLAAQLLNDFGAALEPLARPMGQLADSVNDVASLLIQDLATAFGVVVDIAAPLAQGLANVISAMPPELLSAISFGVVGLAGAFAVLKGAQGVAGAVGALGLFTTAAGRASTTAGKLATGLKGFAGKAGIFGAAAAGALVLADAGVELARSLSRVEDSARVLVGSNAGLKASYNELSGVASGLALEVEDWDRALTDLGRLSNGNPFEAWIMAFDDTGGAAVSLAGTLGELDKQIAPLARQSLSESAKQFSAWANEVGASDAQALNMINTMPEFKKVLEDAALAQGGVATNADLVSLALTGMTGAVTTVGGAFEQAGVGTRGAKDELALLGDEAVNTGFDVDALAEKIRGFGSAELSARDAARNFHESIDRLTEGIAENGGVLALNTAEGRQNEENLDRLATSTLEFAAATVQQTGDQKAANDVIADGRKKLIEQLEAFSITGAEADAYADKLGLIPNDVATDLVLQGLEAADKALNWAARDRTARIKVWADGTGFSIGNTDVTPYARGGNVFGPTQALIGEAGPEAVVPLNRPLSQVDPSVRWLSAIAQGKASPMASGGVVGGGTQVVIEAGAIVVQGAEDPRQTAYEVLDLVADRIGS